MQKFMRTVSTWGVVMCLVSGIPEAMAQTDQARAAARSTAKEGIAAYHAQGHIGHRAVPQLTHGYDRRDEHHEHHHEQGQEGATHDDGQGWGGEVRERATFVA